MTLKRGKLTRSSGHWQDEDYDVLADGKPVGRIYQDASASTPPELRWLWSVAGNPQQTNGHAAMLDVSGARPRPDASSRSARGLGVPLLHCIKVVNER
jgi:beta-phosphoglucomutase-like phosphatase (HAD superfamily)